MIVTVKDTAAMDVSWGNGRTCVITVTGEIADDCPKCGGPRGKPRGFNGYEDGEYYWAQRWDNPCGHVDMYDQIVDEMRARPGHPPHRREPTPLYTCPRCAATSHNPADLEHGYCGRCHMFTRDSNAASLG